MACGGYLGSSATPCKRSSVLYRHPALKLLALPDRGWGYVASKSIRRGELLLEETPFVWDCGCDPSRPDLEPGARWLLETGAVRELPCPAPADATDFEKAEAVAAVCSFRNQTPCLDGTYPALLFRASSRFNHSCFPNAGGYLTGGDEFPTATAYLPKAIARLRSTT